MTQRALPKGKDYDFDYSKQKKLYSYLQAIYMSFYSVNIYVDVRHRWKGFGFLYLLVLTALLTLPFSIYLGVKGNNFYNEVLIPSLERLPAMSVIDGEMSFNKKSPYIINNEKTNKALIIIDTSGEITELPSARYPEAAILITKYTVISKYDKAPADVTKFDSTLSGDMDKNSFIPLLAHIRMIFLIALYPNLTMLFVGLYFSFMAMFAFVMKMFSVILLKYKITFKEALRILTVSATPTFFLLIIGNSLGYNEVKSVQWTLFFVYWGYFIFAIRSNKFAARYPLII